MLWAAKVFSYLDFGKSGHPDYRIENPRIFAFYEKWVSSREVGMACIRLPAMPRSTAEDALIELWVLLEKYGLETPVLAVSFQPDGLVSLNLAITGPARTARLYRGWARQWRRREYAAPEPGIRKDGAPVAALASAG
jgi:hypothetical protein